MAATAEEAHCDLFAFALNSVVTGLLCMLGCAGNSVAFVALWREQAALPTVLFMQAVLIADSVVLSMVFLADAVPSLSYAVPLLHDCSSTCGHVLTVARPILLLGQLCTAWFTVLLAVSHCVSLSSPTNTSKVSGPGAVRLQIIVCATCAVLFTMPRTFDAAVTVSWRTGEGKDVTSALADHPLYRFAYVDVLTLCAQYIVPLVLLACVCVRLTLLLNRRRRQHYEHEQMRQHHSCDTAEQLALSPHPRPPSVVFGVVDPGSSTLHHSHTLQSQHREMECSTLQRHHHLHNHHCNQQHQQQQPAGVGDRALTDVVLMLSLCIFICYLPTALLTLWAVAVGDRRTMCGEVQFYARSFTQLIVVINSAIKMLLLLLFVPHFRLAVRRLCCCFARRQQRANQGQGHCSSYTDNDALMTSSATTGMRTVGGVVQSATPSVRFGPYRCSDTSEMTLMSSVASNSGPGHTPSYVDDVTFWD